jgi:hypothetical protein
MNGRKEFTLTKYDLSNKEEAKINVYNNIVEIMTDACLKAKKENQSKTEILMSTIRNIDLTSDEVYQVMLDFCVCVNRKTEETGVHIKETYDENRCLCTITMWW